MVKLLYAVGTSFLRAFGMSFLMLVTGILAAPNFSAGVSLSIAALIAAIAAGLRAVQVFIPQLSFAAFIRQPLGSWIDAFARAGLSALLVGVIGLLEMPDLPTDRSVWFAVILGALTAGVRALQGLATPGESPAPSTGLVEPRIT